MGGCASCTSGCSPSSAGALKLLAHFKAATSNQIKMPTPTMLAIASKTRRLTFAEDFDLSDKVCWRLGGKRFNVLAAADDEPAPASEGYEGVASASTEPFEGRCRRCDFPGASEDELGTVAFPIIEGCSRTSLCSCNPEEREPERGTR